MLILRVSGEGEQGLESEGVTVHRIQMEGFIDGEEVSEEGFHDSVERR